MQAEELERQQEGFEGWRGRVEGVDWGISMKPGRLEPRRRERDEPGEKSYNAGGGVRTPTRETRPPTRGLERGLRKKRLERECQEDTRGAWESRGEWPKWLS